MKENFTVLDPMTISVQNGLEFKLMSKMYSYQIVTIVDTLNEIDEMLSSRHGQTLPDIYSTVIAGINTMVESPQTFMKNFFSEDLVKVIKDYVDFYYVPKNSEQEEEKHRNNMLYLSNDDIRIILEYSIAMRLFIPLLSSIFDNGPTKDLPKMLMCVLERIDSINLVDSVKSPSAKVLENIKSRVEASEFQDRLVWKALGLSEDVVTADIFGNVIKAIHKMKFDRSIPAFIASIARNQMAFILRQQKPDSNEKLKTVDELLERIYKMTIHVSNTNNSEDVTRRLRRLTTNILSLIQANYHLPIHEVNLVSEFMKIHRIFRAHQINMEITYRSKDPCSVKPEIFSTGGYSFTFDDETITFDFEDMEANYIFEDDYLYIIASQKNLDDSVTDLDTIEGGLAGITKEDFTEIFYECFKDSDMREEIKLIPIKIEFSNCGKLSEVPGVDFSGLE